MVSTALLVALLLASETTAPSPATSETARPTAGDVANGWPSDLASFPPGRSGSVPWLRSATSARLFVHFLPPDRERASVRIVEALAMIAARHGQTFEDADWQTWFEGQPWYRPGQPYSPARLSQGEREAVDLLVRALDDRRER